MYLLVSKIESDMVVSLPNIYIALGYTVRIPLLFNSMAKLTSSKGLL